MGKCEAALRDGKLHHGEVRFPQGNGMFSDQARCWQGSMPARAKSVGRLSPFALLRDKELDNFSVGWDNEKRAVCTSSRSTGKGFVQALCHSKGRANNKMEWWR
jgi:hypothetical protein